MVDMTLMIGQLSWGCLYRQWIHVLACQLLVLKQGLQRCWHNMAIIWGVALFFCTWSWKTESRYLCRPANCLKAKSVKMLVYKGQTIFEGLSTNPVSRLIWLSLNVYLFIYFVVVGVVTFCFSIRGGFKTQPPVDRRFRPVLGGCHCLEQ